MIGCTYINKEINIAINFILAIEFILHAKEKQYIKNKSNKRID